MRLFLDSSALIYYFEGTAALHVHLSAYFTQLKALYPEATFCVSRLCIMECYVKPLRENNAFLLEKYGAFFKTVEIVDLVQNVVEQATLIRAHYGLKTADAIQAACALSQGSQLLFITGDQGFKRVPDLKVSVVSLPTALR